MLSNSRRPPPPPLRLYSPTGVEREAQMDTSSNSPPSSYTVETLSSQSSSPAQASSSSSGSSLDSRMDTISRSSSSSTLTATYEEQALPIKIEEDRPTYYDLRMKWCNRPLIEQHDNLPTSVSLESFLPSPTSSSYAMEDVISAKSLGQSQSDLDKVNSGQHTIDWLGKLAEATLRMDGEVLLFLQSDQDPRTKDDEQ